MLAAKLKFPREAVVLPIVARRHDAAADPMMAVDGFVLHHRRYAVDGVAGFPVQSYGALQPEHLDDFAQLMFHHPAEKTHIARTGSAACVSLIQDDDASPCLCKFYGGRQAGEAGSNNGDVDPGWQGGRVLLRPGGGGPPIGIGAEILREDGHVAHSLTLLQFTDVTIGDDPDGRPI